MRIPQNFILYIKQNILPMFYRVPMRTRVADALYQTQTDMLTAQHNAEYWNSQVHMLELRSERLTRQALTVN